MIPRAVKRPAPAIAALHGHGSSKESVTIDNKRSQQVGEILAQKGYVVAAIDDRVKAIKGVGCFRRYTELIA